MPKHHGLRTIIYVSAGGHSVSTMDDCVTRSVRECHSIGSSSVPRRKGLGTIVNVPTERHSVSTTDECTSWETFGFHYRQGSAVAWWLMPRTPDPEVGGSSPTRVKPCCVLEQGAFTPQKYQEAVAPSMTEKLFTGTLRINQPTNHYRRTCNTVSKRMSMHR